MRGMVTQLIVLTHGAECDARFVDFLCVFNGTA